MSKPKSPLSGAHGGSDFNGKNRKKKSTNPQQQETEKEKVREYLVYKYDKDIPLAEQIILGNKSVFIQIDKEGNVFPLGKLDLSESQGIILTPQPDGNSGIASFTLPIKFKNIPEIKSFLQAAQSESIDSIYKMHKSLWQKLVVFTEESTINFLSIDSVYSNFQDLFETTHYDLIDGTPGSGKGATLITFQLLGYRVVLAADLRGASILDLYGSNGRCQITVAEDELDDIKEDMIKRKIYKIGYDLTGKTTRILDGNTSNRSNRLYEVFGFKIFGTEVASDDKTLEGFNDRIFRLESIKGKPYRRVKKVLLESEKPPEKQDPKYRDIIKEVDYVRKLTFMFRMLHHDDMIKEVETNIDGRPLELTAPQIYLFASESLGSGYALAETKEDKQTSLLITEILPTLSIFLKRKGQLSEKTIQNVVSDALINLMIHEAGDKLIHRSEMDISTNKTTEVLEVAYDLIYNEVKELTDATDSTTPNDNAFYSVEYGKITHREILKICRNPFRGKNGRIRKDNIQAKSMIFDKSLVKTVAEGLKTITQIEVLDGNAERGTEVLNNEHYTEKGQNDDNQEPQNEQGSKTDDIRDNEEDNLEKEQDIDDNIVNNTDVGNSQNADHNDDDNIDLIPCSEENSVPQYRDHDLRKTSECLRNLQEAERLRKEQEPET